MGRRALPKIDPTLDLSGHFREAEALPVPFDDSSDFGAWDLLYEKIALNCSNRDDFSQRDLVGELNDLTFDSLKLSSRGRAAVHDLVRVRFGLTRGKMAPEAVGQPTREEQLAYSRALRDELDGFVSTSAHTRHHVEVLSGAGSGLIAIHLIEATGKQQAVSVLDASSAQASVLAQTRAHLMEQRAQWLYFNRNLRVYDGPRTYILKPLQRLHWTRTQAMADAREIIADSLNADPSLPVGAAV